MLFQKSRSSPKDRAGVQEVLIGVGVERVSGSAVLEGCVLSLLEDDGGGAAPTHRWSVAVSACSVLRLFLNLSERNFSTLECTDSLTVDLMPTFNRFSHRVVMVLQPSLLRTICKVVLFRLCTEARCFCCCRGTLHNIFLLFFRGCGSTSTTPSPAALIGG